MEGVNIREKIIETLKRFFREEAENYGLEMAFLYGSWARGFPREDSDIDIALLFPRTQILKMNYNTNTRKVELRNLFNS